jgi:hypothetical protein
MTGRTRLLGQDNQDRAGRGQFSTGLPVEASMKVDLDDLDDLEEKLSHSQMIIFMLKFCQIITLNVQGRH